MIVELLLNLLYKLLSAIFSVINIPPAPDDIQTALDSFNEYLEMSNGIISLFVPINVVPLLTVALVLFSVEHGFKPVMWIVNKVLEVIP